MNIWAYNDGIIVIIVLFCYYLLDLLLSENSCKGEWVWDREVGESDRQGEVQIIFSG